MLPDLHDRLAGLRMRLRTKYWIVGVAIVLLTIGCMVAYRYANNSSQAERPTSSEKQWFRDVTEESGIQFVHDAGDLSKYNLPQIHGSGVAVFDFDGDGRLD